jgi:two-component system, cell cycle sensor histidine kinase and response regulator CckA
LFSRALFDAIDSKGFMGKAEKKRIFRKGNALPCSEHGSTRSYRERGLHMFTLLRHSLSVAADTLVPPPLQSWCAQLLASGGLLFVTTLRHLGLVVRARERASATPSEALTPSMESLLRLRDRAFAATTTGIVITDARQPDNPLIDCNQAFEQLTGYARAEVLGRNPRFLQCQATDPAALEEIRQALAAQRSCRVVLLNTRRDGTRFWNELSISPVHDEHGQLTHFIGIQTDVTDRVLSEARFQAFMDHTPASAWITNADGVIRYVNQTYLRTFALETAEPIDASIFELFPADVAQPLLDNIQAVAQSGEVLETIEIAPRPNGTAGEFLVYKFPLPVQGHEPLIGGVAVDITERNRVETERRELERKLLETQKLESLGVLAGGIAHDFNNLLVAILGNAEIALHDLEPQHAARSSVEQLRRASQRAAELTSQLLAYSGKGRFLVAPLDLNALVVEMAALLRVSVPKPVTIEQRLAPDLPAIDADSSQVRQVLMNLVINAAEAISGSGIINISTALRTLDSQAFAACVFAPELTPGRYVVVEVTDSGCGMNAETQAKIFEPFFTTKFTGRGLGLAAVLGIIRGHHGAIAITSVVGQGTTISAIFPPSTQSPTAGGAPAEEASTARVPPNEATILLVDDEAEVRNVATRMLRRMGYHVLEAADGLEGLALLQEHAARITGVLLDLTMPKMDGVAVAEQLRSRHPELPIVVMSGYSEIDTRHRFARATPDKFLQKPFTTSALRQALDEVLGDRRPPTRM